VEAIVLSFNPYTVHVNPGESVLTVVLVVEVAVGFLAQQNDKTILEVPSQLKGVEKVNVFTPTVVA
jgi:hypothetical protein